MKLLSLKAFCYRSLRDETIPLTDLNLFIGTNASGKSTILDALRFLHEGLQERDFKPPVFSRGGILHLAWKGEEARQIELLARLENDGKTFEWSVRLTKEGYDFSIQEDVSEFRPAAPPSHLLSADKGRGWWWSGAKGDRVSLAQPPTTCALAAAAVDESFPARDVAEFVSRWGFFDPSPFLLRRGWTGLDSSKFDPYGRNLAERLFALQESSPAAFMQIASATQSVLGLPSQIDLRESRESEDRVYFVQHEPGLKFPVHQVGASSGTLRMLALMTALFGETGSNLIGIEEPENHVHPTALKAFAEYLLKARNRVQILVTTHSPLLLDFLNEPGAVCVVRHRDDCGTRVSRESNVEAVRQALEASGFGLGEFYETKGFGG
ncbi:MAG TPA: AAA family ATPase [Pirellulales bacterium]|nr:AAA family ATPase [Pirellulales bacterium]